MDEFRSKLLNIGQELISDDLHRLKYLCSDIIPAGKMELIATPFKLFQELERMGILSKDKLDFLASCLASIDRIDLRDKLLRVKAASKEGAELADEFQTKKRIKQKASQFETIDGDIVEDGEDKMEENFEYIKHIPFEKSKNQETPKFEILHGETIEDRKSTFQAHLCVITSREQVDQVLDELKKDRKIAKAKYNMWACRIYDEKKKSYFEEGNDDGENLGGERLLHLLQRSDAKNVVIIVTRWHGGIHLGNDRFKHINKCASDLLQRRKIAQTSSASSTDPKAAERDFVKIQHKLTKEEALDKPIVTRPEKEFANFAQLIRLTIDGGTQVLRDVFDSIHPPSSLQSTLLSTAVLSTLKGLRAKRILTNQQWERLYPASRSTPVTSADFDMTLLFVLLRNICGLTPPPTGWDNPPFATDLTREADLGRVKYYRNELYDNITETAVSDSDFDKYWSKISDVLVRLGGPRYKSFIERIKVERMDLDLTTAADEIAEKHEASSKPSVTRTMREFDNFARLTRLTIDGGTLVLRDVFDSIHPPRFLHSTLLSTAVLSTLKGLRAKRILTKQQWDRLYPATRSTPVISADFDMILLFELLRRICGLTPPPTGWHKLPVATNLSREADLVRLKYYANELFGCITETAVSDSDFEKHWSEISDVLVRLGGPHFKSFIERIKVENMNLDFTKSVDEIARKHEASSKPSVTRTMPREFDNFSRLIRLTIDGGTLVLRDVFDSIHPPSSLHSTLLRPTVLSTLKDLKAMWFLTNEQWDRLYPASRSTPLTSADFDMTLLFVLLRDICGLTPPSTGWNQPPVATDLCREADLVRLENYRNDILSGATTVSDREFERYWSKISDVLVRLGGPRYKSFIERIKVENMDLDFTTAADEIAGKHEDDAIPSEILARGPEALKAYEEALESGKTKNRRLLVMVVGPARAGKTSLLKSLNGEEFDPKEDSTDGIQLQRTFCKSQENCWSKESDKGISYADCMADIIHKNLQGGDDSEEIHDENFAKARKESIEKSVESSESLSKNDDDDRDEDHDDVDNANDDDDAHGHDDNKMNAIKVESEETDEEANEELEVKEYISEKSTAILPQLIEEKVIFKLMDTKLSDKTNRENEVYIKSLDFAGQAVYNVIHPIFLTSKAVFILVYNLKNIPHHLMKSIVEEDGAERELVDPFEMTNMENLELWLSCISSYTDTQRMAKIGELSLPPVFLAGTHADRFDGNLEAAKKIIREIYKSLSPSKNPSGSHVVRNKIYTVNNSISGNGEINDESVRKLKADIEELSKSLPHMNEDIPINWVWFEEKLSNLVENENKKYITIDEALKIANECKVNTSAESKEFLTLLNYLHDLKTVIYFEETKKVFIDTEWLVKVFTKVIEVRPVEKRDGFDESWDKLEEKGVLDRALVEHVWEALVDHEQNTIDALLLIMEKFSLICRWNTSEGEEVYLVPCMLCNSEKREDIAKCLEHEKSSTMVIRFNISHVSLGIFPRLFVAIAEEGKKIWPNLEKPELHKNICRIFEIGKERNLDICIIQSSFQTISVTVCNIQNIDGQRVTEFCQVFRKLLDQIFVDMWRNFPWMQNMTFEYGILCPVCTTSPNKCKSHEKERCTRDTCLHFVNGKELSVDTPKCKKYVANLDNVIEEKAYVYWFPRQVVGSTLDLTENQKRWLVISICLNIVLLPPLRKFLEPNILNHYTNLKASDNIHNQVHGGQLVNDAGQALNYRSINNNATIKKVKDYDYKVTSAVDLAKLYLQSHMAQFTGFNDTCDLSAVLGVLSSASVFSADIQDLSRKVRKDVRNEWGHCNFQSWDETKFADSFNLMHSLLKALKLSSDDENTVAHQLKEWENKCEEMCMANTVPPELVKDIEDKVSQLSREFQLALRRNEENVAQLSEDVERLAISQKEEVCRVLETLMTVQDAVRSLKQRMGLVENRVENVENRVENVEDEVKKVKEEVRKVKEEVKRAHERIDCPRK